MSSKLYRALSRPAARWIGLACLLLGWVLTAYAAEMPASADETMKRLDFAAKEGGLLLLVLGVFGWVARLVSKPAAREVVADHVEKLHGEENKERKEVVKALEGVRIAIASLPCHPSRQGAPECPEEKT